MDLLQFADLLLTATDPRDAAERTLRWLREQHGARSAALWCSNGTDLALQLSLGVDDGSLAGARALWAHGSDGLATGQPAIDGHRALIPTRPKGSYLYLDGIDPRRLDIALAADGAAVAINALHRKAVHAPGLRRHGADDVRRDELIATLRLHEWNLARVARVKGVSRKTVYDWLEKYHIERERIRKS